VPVLATTSMITGTWSPATINNATGGSYVYACRSSDTTRAAIMTTPRTVPVSCYNLAGGNDSAYF
jgi:hypothetical protein